MIDPIQLRKRATGSGAERWMNCPASVALSYNIEEPEKKYATEGTKAHFEAARILGEGLQLSEKVDEAIRVYVETVRSILPAKGSPNVEERLNLLGSSGGVDCYYVDGSVGYIFDFKYGVGIRLQAFENEQLAFYAVALKEKYPQLTKIQVYLIQPRVEGVFEDTPSISSWTLPWQTLKAWRHKFEVALQDVEKGTKIEAGPWCRFCSARGMCPAQVAYADAIERAQGLEPIREEIENPPAITRDNLPADIPRIARILLAKKRVMSWFDKAEEYLLMQAQAGAPVPGFVLGRKRSMRKWHTMMDEDEIAAELTARGLQQPWERSLMPITRAEKEVNLDGLTEKPDGAECLKPAKE